MQVDSCKTIFGVSLPRKVMVDELGSQELVTITSETSSQKFGGMYNGEQAWSACGWFRKELRKRTTVMAVVGKVLYVHATIEPAFLERQIAWVARDLGIAGPTGTRLRHNLEGHHKSRFASFAQYSLTHDDTGRISDSDRERVGSWTILKRRLEGDEGMTSKNREKLFKQIDIKTWKALDHPYNLCLG